jgi:hypothetical protein
MHICLIPAHGTAWPAYIMCTPLCCGFGLIYKVSCSLAGCFGAAAVPAALGMAAAHAPSSAAVWHACLQQLRETRDPLT